MKKLWLLKFIILLLITPLYTWGAEISLWLWKPVSTQLSFVIPVRQGLTVQQEVQNYLSAIDHNSDLSELFQGRTPLISSQDEFREFKKNDAGKSVLMLANNYKDYTKNSQRVTNFDQIFKQQGQTSYLLPIAAGIHLSLNEKRQMHKEISQRFSLLVALGGDDVDPKFYKADNHFSINTNSTRDQMEIDVIKSYIQEGRGYLLGVCRGSQITSVALGYKMHQDLPFQVGDKVSHANDWHPIQLVGDSPDSFFKKMGFSQKIEVNSLHHQAVKFTPNGPLELLAVGHDGVTEATEFKNRRGVLFQFHPELMNNELGSKIIENVVRQKQKKFIYSCSKLF